MPALDTVEASRLTLDRFDALLIDVDGTLVDSAGPVRRAWAAFARRRGLDPVHVITFAQGRPSRDTIGDLVALPEEADEELRLVELAEVGDTEGTVALPGAAALLGSGRTLAIVTSCSLALASVRLEAAGLPIPEVVVSCDDIDVGKPHPACFLLGASRLGVAPERCLVLEDSPAGVRAGLDAGAHVIAVRTTHSDAQLAEAHAIVDDLSALVAPA